MNRTLEAWRYVLHGEIDGDVVYADYDGERFQLRLDPSEPGGFDVRGKPPQDDLRDFCEFQFENAETLVTDDLLDLVEADIEPREYLLSPILMEQGAVEVVGYRGVGKSLVAMGSALAVAGGGPFLRWKTDRPRKTLLIDGEMPGKVLRERSRAALAGAQPRPARGFIRLVSMDRQRLGFSLNLADPSHQALVEAEIDDAELLILDNISTLVRDCHDDNAVEAWRAMQPWLLHLRRKGLTVLLVHHASRGGGGRGTSAREDILDVVVELRRPANYEPSQGARFEVHLTKARGVFGADAKPFEARLETRDGVDHWSCEDIRDPEFEAIRDLSKRGRSVREIAAEAGLSKSTVSRKLTEGRARGDL
jgi:putative DNA primase/helicase